MKPRILVVTEAQYALNRDGTVVALDYVNGDSQWRRYKPHLRDLVVMGRLRQVRGDGAPLVEHRLIGLPPYSGIGGLPRAVLPMVVQIWKAIRQADLVVLRVPGPISTIAGLIAFLQGRPYAAEVVGDAGEVLRAGAAGNVGRSLAPFASFATRRLVRGAIAVRYVTKHALQRQYPAASDAFQLAVPNVQLQPNDFADAPRSSGVADLNLLAVGSQETSYKGHDVAIQAVKALIDRGLYPTLVLIGGGRTQAALKKLAAELGVSEHVHFLGQVDKDDVVSYFRRADLLLHPSRTEGLPRVVLEAAAQGLPVIASRVGGLPEIVPESNLVKVGDPVDLADHVVSLTDKSWYAASSSWGFTTAHAFDAAACADLFERWTESLYELAEQASRQRSRKAYYRAQWVAR